MICKSNNLDYLKLGLSQPHYGQVWGWSPTLGKVRDLESLGIWSPKGLPNFQSSTTRPKTPRIGVFLVSLERSWNVDIENGLALVIWTSAARVMGKRRAGSQTDNLTPDHKKSGIDLFPTSDSSVQHGVGKISTRATTLVQTSLRLDSTVGSYGRSKFWESSWDNFGTPFRESQQNVPFGCSLHYELQRILHGGRWWLPPSPGRGESCVSKCPSLVPTPKGVPNAKLTSCGWFWMQIHTS
jgi:hypothetical protein